MGELRVRQCLSVNGIGARLVGQQQGGAGLRGGRAQVKCPPDVTGARQPAGGDHREIVGHTDGGQQRVQRLLPRSSPGIERAAVPAGLGPLHHQHVGAGTHGDPGLVERGDRDCCEHTARAQPGEGLRRRAAERERRHLGCGVGDHVDLGVPGVVVGVGLAGRGAEALGQRRELFSIAVESGGSGQRRLRHKEIHTNRPGGRGANSGDTVGELLRGQVAGRQEAQPAGVGHRRRQGRGAGSARHRRPDDGDRQIGQAEHQPASSGIDRSGWGSDRFGRLGPSTAAPNGLVRIWRATALTSSRVTPSISASVLEMVRYSP